MFNSPLGNQGDGACIVQESPVNPLVPLKLHGGSVISAAIVQRINFFAERVTGITSGNMFEGYR
jgi:hypothetical protein